MTAYRIKYVHDELLDGRDFVICNDHEDGVSLFLRRGIRDLTDVENEAALEEVWNAYREMIAAGVIPPQRVRSSA